MGPPQHGRRPALVAGLYQPEAFIDGSAREIFSEIGRTYALDRLAERPAAGLERFIDDREIRDGDAAGCRLFYS
jgi:hypothetical protein